MNKGKPIPIIFLMWLLASCNSYELMHYQGSGLDKVEDAEKHKIYITAQKKVFKVAKPSITTSGISGDVVLIKDEKEAEEIRTPATPAQLKKHKHDLNIVTETKVPDSAANISLPKGQIKSYNLVVAHSKINWKKIGDIIAAVLGIAVCLALIGALIYWISFI